MANDPSLLRAWERVYGPFTHMSQQEKSIWLRWLMAGGSQFAPFQYDVRVGDGLIMPPGSSTFAVSAAYALTTKRIDVIYNHAGFTVIVEVKVRAGLSVIGQLIGYRDLLIKTPGWNGETQMLLVTDELQPDVAGVLQSSGIQWNIVQP